MKDDRFVEEALNEVQAMAKLSHPNILKVIDSGQDYYIKPSGSVQKNYVVF